MKRIEEESFIDKADEIAGGWLTELRRALPGIARACLMASTIEDSFRYWRDFNIYNTYFANLWMRPDLEPDYWTAAVFIWPLILKIIPAMFIVSNLLDKKVQKSLCFLFYIFGLWNMVGLQGYPGGRNFNLWQINQLIKFWCAITLVFAEASEESKNLFAGLPSLNEKFTKQSYLALLGRLMFGWLFFAKLHFNFSHWRFVLDWIVNLPCVLMIVLGFKTKLVSLVYMGTLLFDNFYFHQFWVYFGNPYAYEHVAYSFFSNLTIVGVCLQWIIYGPGGISLDKSLKSD